MGILPSVSGTCRLCGDWHENTDKGKLIKYSVRHYAHVGCALDKWGAAFFDRLRDWQIEQFPYMPAQRRGLGDELARRCEEAQKRRGANV